MGLTRTRVFPGTGLDMEPAVADVGPFPRTGFLRAWWEELAPDGDLVVVEANNSALILFDGGAYLEFAGDTDLTDYHSPLGTDVTALCLELAAHLGPRNRISLDSLPAEGAKLLHEGLVAAGLTPHVVEFDLAMVLDLPASVEEFYALVGKKDRHELRRKRRRYETEVGPLLHRTHTGTGFGIEEFIRLHRLAAGRKGKFMTTQRANFFTRLATLPGWRVDLLERGGRATAALFGWADDRGYYLYNSCFDPSLQGASPGLVLLTSMIETAIRSRLKVFDFLKGDEGYKSRMGARSRQLYHIEVRG
jgi:CelD/BcsL family acetyltransferase involved in cellulose biosynthesis